MRNLAIMMLVPLLAVVVGCAGDKQPERQAKKVMGIRPRNSYAPLSDYKLTLRTENRFARRVGFARANGSADGPAPRDAGRSRSWTGTATVSWTSS